MTQKEKELKIASKQTIDLATILPETDNLLITKSISALEFAKEHNLGIGTLEDDDWSTLEEQFGTKYLFFYRLERLYNNKPLCGELGLGSLLDSPEGFVLQRTFPQMFADENGVTSHVTAPQTQIADNWNNSSKIFITCVFPNSLTDVTIHPNVMVYSTESSPFNPLYVKENSLAGRIKGSIRNISFTELFKKITQLSLTQLILTTPKKPKEVEGSIVYDNKTKSLKFFDGEVWKRLVNEET
jgi:hypothetical protein